jgi:hypothetical protein
MTITGSEQSGMATIDAPRGLRAHVFQIADRWGWQVTMVSGPNKSILVGVFELFTPALANAHRAIGDELRRRMKQRRNNIEWHRGAVYRQNQLELTF